MSHRIGNGTCNISINCPTDERQIIGQLAFRLGFRSVGDFMRHLVLSGLEREDIDSAERVKAIRRAYYGSTMLVIFIAAMAWGHSDVRRTARRVRVEEEVREEEVI